MFNILILIVQCSMCHTNCSKLNIMKNKKESIDVQYSNSCCSIFNFTCQRLRIEHYEIEKESIDVQYFDSCCSMFNVTCQPFQIEHYETIRIIRCSLDWFLLFNVKCSMLHPNRSKLNIMKKIKINRWSISLFLLFNVQCYMPSFQIEHYTK